MKIYCHEIGDALSVSGFWSRVGTLGFGEGSFRGEFFGLSTRVVHRAGGFEYSLVQFNTVWRTRARIREGVGSKTP